MIKLIIYLEELIKVAHQKDFTILHQNFIQKRQIPVIEYYLCVVNKHQSFEIRFLLFFFP